MEKDLDKNLYKEYLEGNKEAFEYLYNKYKTKIEYFIYNIIKDYSKAEDLAQETFIYIMQNPIKDEYSFKYHIYLVSRSKSLNYLKVEKRRNEINELYLRNDENISIEDDVIEIITKEETKKELLEAIELLDEKYKNAIYLANIEGLRYKEISEILDETISNTKTLIHRGKKQLKKILIKKEIYQTNRSLKIVIMIICMSVVLSGIVYATTFFYNSYKKDDNIKKQNKINSRGLFDLGDGITTYEIDLMANDMIWNSDVRLYHKIIENVNDYQIYKERVEELPEVDEINFDENFVIIIANENIRYCDEIDMEIYEITSDDMTTYIKMKQRDNPDYNDESNIWYAIVDKSLLRDNIDISIKHKELNTGGALQMEELPDVYTIEMALNDGCFVVENNKIKSTPSNALDEFIAQCENGKSGFIRVINYYTGSWTLDKKDYFIVSDVEFNNGSYYLKECDFSNRKRIFTRSYNKLIKCQTEFGEEYDFVFNENAFGARLILLQDVPF